MPAWLNNHLGKEYLEREYLEMKRSTVEIAQELGTYPNKVIRALKAHKIPLRDRSEARTVALDNGRALPPMLGRVHTEETRELIKRAKTNGKKENGNPDARDGNSERGGH